MITTRILHADIYTPLGSTAVRGENMASLWHLPDAEIEVTDKVITYIGAERTDAPKANFTIDAERRAVLPGFVDSHTHLVFGGYRPDEFMWRIAGDTYMEIMERGGGIVSTMKATREATPHDLYEKAKPYLQRMLQMGVTTVEAKSGYGLDKDAELKMLDTINLLNASNDRIDIVATYLGAHAVPPEWADCPDGYINLIINDILPIVKDKARFCDVFCEKGVFTPEQSRRLLQAAKDLGMGIKLHADEIVTTGGAELAAELGAVSADHLLHVSDEGIRALAKSQTIATLLPLTAFTLREEYAPARKMIDAGCAVALATDLNPGSCLSGSIPLMFALACIYMDMTTEEAITALTLNGAAALGLAERIGSLEVGKQGDMVILDSGNINMLPYYTAMNSVRTTIKGGIPVANNDPTSPKSPYIPRLTQI
ncbi:MAG: imidazolonepropionase [Bacteroidales bacterium]|nr:imidazolonepropionase [Bacteroidales bacterium]